MILISPPQLNATANKIIHLLQNRISQTQIHQIKTQLILLNLHSNSTIAHHFITACQTPSLLHSTLPLFLTHLSNPHVFTCNTLLKAFSHSQIANIPYSIYSHMHHNSISPNNYTFPLVFKSLSDFKDFKQGQCVQTHVIKMGYSCDIYVLNSLLDLYASCGFMDECRKVFDEMPLRDVVSWTILIVGYRNDEHYGDALIAFEQMQYAGVLPNRVTMVNVLGACASFGAIEMGCWIHDFVRRNGWEVDVILGTSLIDMYAKCGRIDEGLNVFRSMKENNIFTWNAVIRGLAFARCGKEAVRWFNYMEQEGVKPDEVTLVNVLSACSHSGLIDIGKQIFDLLIIGKYGCLPNAKHYACMIDLYARLGYVDEAFKFIRDMPFEPTKAMWGSLLACCKTNKNLELSEYAARKLVELEPDNSAYYVVLSNLYSEIGRWTDAAKVREFMRDKGLKKDMGSSSAQSLMQKYDKKLLVL
ncbi:pentatricopeptide repeat-containing protein At5g56310-like [Mercurialis annua]|uniref:pentatricopeptide repeat-containing protein At5g56310-like n=1 Tax=Mercurialis annua TaxID=3986 RepID=UPI00215ECC10|nr:pentatricopeptide repeat-containing protein At5g56310-like [Mercurialis annua]